MKKKLSRLMLPHSKHTANVASAPIQPPKEVLIPMSMQSGSPAVPVVSVGDYVRIGQLIAKEEGRFSSPVYASVSGTVKAIEERRLCTGKTSQAIRIESDGKMEKDPAVKAPEVHNLDEFLDAVRQSGIVGLGGGAFPVWAKLDAVRKNPIKTVLINGAECEPFITSDTRTMVENSAYVVKGVELLRKYLGSEEFIIGIEDNKPEAIEVLRRAFEGDSSVKILSLECSYPQGAKQMLLYNATGKVVYAGQRLASLGVIIINVTSLAKVAQYMEDGMPLVDRIITVDGSAIKKPCNLVAPVGTSIRYLIEQAGGFGCEPGKIILGGPMMGYTVSDIDEPVVKATNAVLAFNKKDARMAAETACIRCGRCVENCPMGLNPVAFAAAMELEDDNERAAILDRESVNFCMECGCCSYVCPAHRPLVHYNVEGMSFLRSYKAAQKEGSK